MVQTIIHYEKLILLALIALHFQASLVRLLGWLIFGRISAYEFIYIKFHHWLLIKKNGKLCLRKFFLRRPVVLCTMFAQAEENKSKEKFHLSLYLQGGPIANLISSVLFFILAFLLQHHINYYFYMFLLWLGIIGAVYGFNLLPFWFKRNSSPLQMSIASINNDKVRNDFFDYFYVLKNLADNVSILEMDKKHLQIDRPLAEVGVQNLGIRREYHLLNNEIENSKEITQYILANQDKIPPLDVISVKIDLLFNKIKTEIIEDKTAILDSQLLKHFKQNKKLPQTIVFNYAVALLIDKNQLEANNQLELLEKIKISYPFEQVFNGAYKEIAEIKQIYENRKK